MFVLNDTLLLEKGRGDARNDPPRRVEARFRMVDKPKGVSSTPPKKLRDALTAAEMRIFEVELAALEDDLAKGKIPAISKSEAIRLFEPSVK